MANQKLDESARGVFAISATPFTDDGAVDQASTDRMVDFYLESGVGGLTILGVMGEAPKMSPDESSEFCDRVLRRVDDRVPVAQLLGRDQGAELPILADVELKARDERGGDRPLGELLDLTLVDVRILRELSDRGRD